MVDNLIDITLPKYRCHKEVWALKIKEIQLPEKPTLDELEKILNSKEEVPVEILQDGSVLVIGDIGATIFPDDENYAPIKVTRDYMIRHRPVVGGYYVIYEDGYKSFSPAKAFEDGYTLIS